MLKSREARKACVVRCTKGNVILHAMSTMSTRFLHMLVQVFEALQQNAQLWNSQQLDSSTSMPQRAGTAMTHDSSMGATSTAAPVGSIIPKHCGGYAWIGIQLETGAAYVNLCLWCGFRHS
jgi:hypothetical protein